MQPKSLLTRQLFRALLSNQPYRIPGCLLHIPSSRSHPQHQRTKPFSTSHRRDIFGLSIGSTFQSLLGAQPGPNNVKTALNKLAEFLQAQRRRTRLPPDAEILDAFRFLFSSLATDSRPFSRQEAFIVAQVFAHLQRNDRLKDQPILTKEDIRDVLTALAHRTAHMSYTTEHLAFVNAVVKAFEQSQPVGAELLHSSQDSVDRELFASYITILTHTSSSSKALQLLTAVKATASSLWMSILRGFLLERSMRDFWGALGVKQQVAGRLTAAEHEELCCFLAARGSSDTANMLKYGTNALLVPTTPCLAAVLNHAMLSKATQLAADLASQLESRSDLGDSAGILLVFYASQDRSLDYIKPKLNHLVKNSALDLKQPAIFNRLIQFAYTKHDAVLAQSYIDFAKSFGWRPDAVTWLARLDAEIERGNIDLAAETFNALSHEEIPTNRSDIPVLNRYLVLLSTSGKANSEQLMRVLDSLLETNGVLYPVALAGLVQYFLKLDDLVSISSLLLSRVEMLPPSDRELISDAFTKHILSSLTKDQPAWNAYDLQRLIFTELTVTTRISIMHSFFTRQRPDLACLIFGHMRQSPHESIRPTAAAYAECFTGIAEARDLDGLQMVYNMLKMDTMVEPTTHIRNSLISAYTACRSPFTAIIDHFWKILESREGPTLNSFILALQSAETWVPQGSQEARRIIALMQSWDMIITKDIYDAYIGAIAGQCEFENVVELIECMHEDIGEDPDYFTLGTFYNAIPFQYRKDEVQKWAEQRYPELWAQLLDVGDDVDEDWMIRYFKIDRKVHWGDELLFEKDDYAPELAQRAVLSLGDGGR